jgi:2-oxoacid:acceptor oxidoreductase delta subunit (pyruvate/2-ketoisovalerate family)
MGMDKEYEGSWRKANDFFARPTGTWAERTPEISISKCGQCGLCVIYCPTGCIVEKEEHFLVNLDYCKGCGVCAKECPSKAITMLEKNP